MKSFIFIHIPKTAGISMKDALEPYWAGKCNVNGFNTRIPNGKGVHLGHISIFHLLNNRKRVNGKLNSVTQYDYDNTFKFCFVRNPWDRAVSLWRHLKKRGIHKYKRFDRFIYWLRDSGCRPIGLHNVDGNSQANQQVDWIYNDGKCVADFVGRFENLQHDFNRICSIIGVPEIKLMKKNTTSDGNYRDNYDTSTKKVVARMYEKDISTFEYRY